jgi:hypothetical protein
LPTSAVERIVAPFWDDLNPQPNTPRNVFWEVLGSAPDRELVVEWRNLNHGTIAGVSEDAAVTFQVVFFENSDDILFNYRDVNFSDNWPDYNGGGTAAIGLQSAWGFATQYGCCVPSLSDLTSILWSPGSSSTPVVNYTDPPELYADSSDLYVKGNYFQPGAVLYWNDVARKSNFESSDTLHTALEASDLTPGSYSIYVRNPGGEQSNAIDIRVHNGDVLTPHIDSISPASVLAGTTGAWLTINGTGFIPGLGQYRHSMATLEWCAWNCIPLATTVVNDTQLTAAVPDSAVSGPITWRVGVENIQNNCISNFVDFAVTSSKGPTLTVRAGPGGLGAGLVEDDQGKIVCRTDFTKGPQSCPAVYAYGDVVTLRATPTTNFIGGHSGFMGWSGACTSLGTCTVTMDSDKVVTADFGGGGRSLSIVFDGQGVGMVRDPNNGFSCTESCTIWLQNGQSLTLTAEPAPGSFFAGWSGKCSGLSTCSFTLLEDANVGVTFGLGSFAFINPPAARNVTAGQSAQFTLEVQGQSGFAGAVSFACASGLPKGVACSFNPSSVNPGSGTVTTTLTVTTTSRTVATSSTASVSVFACWLLPLGLLVSPRAKHSRQRALLASFAVLVFLAGSMAACGRGSKATSGSSSQINPSGTPAGTSTIMVTGTSGSISKTQAVTLVVK